MGKDKKMVTLFKGGTDEKTLHIDEITIPDLWHIAQKVRTGEEIYNREVACETILKVWHIAAWLKEHIQNLK